MIRFHRYGRLAQRERSPRRIAAAKRAIARDIENNALTPELVKPENQDTTTRLDHYDSRAERIHKRMRKLQAKHWREGRAFLRALEPDMKAICLELWNSEPYPLTGTYFCTHVRRCLTHPAEILDLHNFLHRHDSQRSLQSS